MKCLKFFKSTFPASATFLITSLFLLTACDEQKLPAVQPSLVQAITVQTKDAPLTYEFVGSTASSQQVEVRARVEGFLDERLYAEGSIINKGDIMFQMDAKPFATQVAAAKAALAQQQAKLTTSSANLKRVKPLAAANAVSKKELDDAQGRVSSAAAAVDMSRAELDTAILNLGYTTIHAPVTGASSYARVQNGAYINTANSLLTTVAQLDPIWVNFNISENEMLKARDMKSKGIIIMPEKDKFDVELVLADGSVYPQTGHIFFNDASYSTETGTFLIRATFENPERNLSPGQFVRVLLKGGIQPNAILVPQKAVSQGAKGFFVWIIDNEDKAQIRNVEVGAWQGDDWFILSGLSNGDRVVTDGFMSLSANKPVSIQSGNDKTNTSNPE
ncbi:MAG: efflux RND transporter periplasmic adaptor subunit [Gammaproteobacteria bacterium]|nr:efflux RND transporter periplasmic adaptor subunit [Gammaproteobacteria bacterium]